VVNKKRIICTEECPVCGGLIEITTIGETICPHCGGAEAELTVNWTIIKVEDNDENT
jgi:hypothetical protein